MKKFTSIYSLLIGTAFLGSLFVFWTLFNLWAVPSSAAVVEVLPVAETDACHNSGDTCDDSAIWIHPSDPSMSTVIGDDKDGGVVVWDLSGNELQYLDAGLRINNLDLRYHFPLS